MASPEKKTTQKADTNPARRLRKPKHGLKARKQVKHSYTPVPSAWQLLKQSLKHVFIHWKVFLGITFVYLVLTVALVKGFGVTTNIEELKTSLQGAFSGKTAGISTGLTVFTVLLGSAGGATTEVAGAYQTILLVVVSLALIWALRQTHAKSKLTVKDAFYKGLYPLVPFTLILLVVGIQLIPLLLSGALYNFVFGNRLAVQWYEQVGWGIGLFLLILWSLYMVSASIFSLYIVTLPDVRPLQALRSAKELVRFRRWTVLRRVVFLPVALLILSGLIVVPLILFAAPVVEWVFFSLTMFSLAAVHSYMYSLYRSLL